MNPVALIYRWIRSQGAIIDINPAVFLADLGQLRIILGNVLQTGSGGFDRFGDIQNRIDNNCGIGALFKDLVDSLLEQLSIFAITRPDSVFDIVDSKGDIDDFRLPGSNFVHRVFDIAYTIANFSDNIGIRQIIIFLKAKSPGITKNHGVGKERPDILAGRSALTQPGAGLFQVADIQLALQSTRITSGQALQIIAPLFQGACRQMVPAQSIDAKNSSQQGSRSGCFFSR